MVTNRNKDSKVIEEFLSVRGNLIELFVIAFLLAFGTSIISNYLFNVQNINYKALLYVGIFLCVVSFGLIIFRKITKINFGSKLESFFIYDDDNKRLVRIPKYEFSCSLFDTLESVFFENKAMLATWEKEPLSEFKPSKSMDYNGSSKLLVEVIEHYLVDKLSTHLSTYFKNNEESDNIVEYGRNDIPDLLLNNKIIELISKPIEEREKFLDSDKRKNLMKIICQKEDGTEIIESVFCEGARFERFNLTLPKGSKVKRVRLGCIEISTPKLNIIFDIDFKGFNTFIPKLFISRYLKLPNDKDRKIESYLAYINVTVKIKLISLLTVKGWEYHKWVDSFIETLHKDVSKEDYFDKLDWNKIEALLITLYRPERNIEKECINNKDEAAATLEKVINNKNG